MAGILKVDQVQSDSNLSFQVAGANVAYMNSTGLQMTGGQIIAGSNTLLTASGLIYANAGIAFPGTQASSADANTLDDYEEGTWTATASPSTSGSITFDGDNTLFYTKVGRIVTVSGRLDVQSVSSPSGELRITLPFTVGNAGQTASSSASVFIWNAGGAATEAGLWISWLEPNAAFVYFRYGNTGTPAGNAAQYIQSGTEFRFNVTYVVA
jgi:hypothetical protein